MTRVLVRKLLVDIRVGFTTICLLLFLFQMLWAHVSRRIVGDILKKFAEVGLNVDFIRDVIFKQSGKIVESIMGGGDIRIDKAFDLVTIAYVHPLTLTILCIWAVGRASAAIAGELDRGTMELLLAQPIRRSQIILAHLLVDLITIPFICLVMWAGTWLGTWLVGFQHHTEPAFKVDPWRFWPGLLSVFGLAFAVSGYTMWFSARGRFRNRVLGWCILMTLLQFIVNVIGQLWPTGLGWMRPVTVFYHYQPQPLILKDDWYSQAENWEHVAVLVGVGIIGYLLAWWKFCKRDLPAPL